MTVERPQFASSLHGSSAQRLTHSESTQADLSISNTLPRDRIPALPGEKSVPSHFSDSVCACAAAI